MLYHPAFGGTTCGARKPARVGISRRGRSMPAARSITYTVFTFSNGAWKAEGQTQELDRALQAAERLFGTKRFQKVKVDQSYVDEKNRRNIVTTVFDRRLPTAERSILLPLGLAVALAIATYFAVRWGLDAFVDT